MLFVLSRMQSGINVVIHHGGKFTEKSRLKYYKGGKLEFSFNQSPDIQYYIGLYIESYFNLLRPIRGNLLAKQSTLT